MKAEVKIVRNGNAAGINIPRQVLIRLGWIPGQRVICELLEDNTLRLRDVRIEDFHVGRARVVYDEPATVVTK